MGKSVRKECVTVEITRQGQVETLVGNPPEVGQDLPHFKLFNVEYIEIFRMDYKS